jgi:hypothetical protein
VIPGRGDETPGAGDRSRLRASHADREQVIDVVKAAFVQGRLAKDEFDQRLGRVFASRTYADLASLTADIPAGLARAQPPPRPIHMPAAQVSRDKKMVRAWAGVVIASPTIVAAVTVMEGGTTGGAAVVLFLVIVATCLVAVPVSGMVALHSWYEKRSSS